MKRVDRIKNMDAAALAEWIDKLGYYGEAPWMSWWDETYCKNCPSVEVEIECFNRKMSCAWCELHGGCKFFPESTDIPDYRTIIQMWLEEEEV